MLLRCQKCREEYIVPHKYISNSHYYCKKCLSLENKTEITRLGLHPALAKKLVERQDKTIKAPTRINNTVSSAMPLVTLPKIPGFEIYYEIGRGAMGNVFKARQTSTGQMVAIKILGKNLSLRSDLVARFERETYALKALRHENVVRIIDAGRIENTNYFAMEFIEGMTLRTRMGRAKISLNEACYITEQILNGLKIAHGLGIVHRDLKPENVLLSYQTPELSKMPSRVVLVDFGLVGIGGLSFDPHPNLTRSKVTMGTINYMAPEQHIDAKRVDQRTDIYSAGVIIFEMLTGELPLGRYLLPHERGLGVPKKIDDILSKALARAIEERYLSVEDFLSDLNELKKSKQQKEKLENNNINNNFLINQNSVFKLIKKNRYWLFAFFSMAFFALGIKLAF